MVGTVQLLQERNPSSIYIIFLFGQDNCWQLCLWQAQTSSKECLYLFFCQCPCPQDIMLYCCEFLSSTKNFLTQSCAWFSCHMEKRENWRASQDFRVLLLILSLLSEWRRVESEEAETLHFSFVVVTYGFWSNWLGSQVDNLFLFNSSIFNPFSGL